mmetsp:Transcript_9969/g.21315  ORF Transcript_9969/g.21315 Transcript_9969/m.21315 type:complete len:90 (-) Transcript_9969:277-546(-)
MSSIINISNSSCRGTHVPDCSNSDLSDDNSDGCNVYDRNTKSNTHTRRVEPPANQRLTAKFTPERIREFFYVRQCIFVVCFLGYAVQNR